MKIVGLEKLSLIDFPGRMSTVLFTEGCNFRCYYCHNKDFINLDSNDIISEEYLENFLLDRKKFINSITITGGEPCINKDLIDYIKKYKEKGFLIKLDTNGSFPSTINQLIEENLVDYIAMDIKTSFKNYEKVICKNLDIEKIKTSIDILINSDIEYEFRTTVTDLDPSIEDILDIIENIKGAKRYFLQRVKRGETVLDNSKTIEINHSKDNQLIELEKKYSFLKLR